MKGLFSQLTPEQQKLALEYRGEENHGDNNMISIHTIEKLKTVVDEYNKLHNEYFDYGENSKFKYLTLRKNRKDQWILIETLKPSNNIDVESLPQMIEDIKKNLDFQKNYTKRFAEIDNRIRQFLGEDDYKFFMHDLVRE